MAIAKKQRHAKPKAAHAKKLPFHAFWSGALSFGLVNVPVLVFPASRHSSIRLRMISPDGEFLERRFYCPRDGKEVGSDDIVPQASNSTTARTSLSLTRSSSRSNQ